VVGFWFVLFRIAFIGAVFLYSGNIGGNACESLGGSSYGDQADSIRRLCRGNVLMQFVDLRKWTPRSLASDRSTYDACKQATKQEDSKVANIIKSKIE
jgi:hypothetical protein